MNEGGKRNGTTVKERKKKQREREKRQQRLNVKLKHTRERGRWAGRINFQDTLDTQKPIRFSLTGRGTGKAGTS